MEVLRIWLPSQTECVVGTLMAFPDTPFQPNLSNGSRGSVCCGDQHKSFDVEGDGTSNDSHIAFDTAFKVKVAALPTFSRLVKE